MTARRALPWLLLAAAVAVDVSSEVPHPRRSTPPEPIAASSSAMTTPSATDRFPTARGELVVSPLEHATVLLGWNGLAIYVDPTSPAIDHAELPRADVVFLTDIHFDHLDPVVVARLSQPGTVVVGPAAAADRTHVDVVLANGEARDVRGIGVTAVPMYNVTRGPAPGLLYHPRGRGNGYVLDLGGTRVYFSGDTECTPEMKALERIDLAFVSMSLPTTMPPSEAAQCALAFHPRVLIPYHDRWADLAPLEQALAGSGIDLRARDLYPRAEQKRREAVVFCEKHQWGICRDRLDEARELDPRMEDRPDVRRMRDQIAYAMAPYRIPM